MGAACLAVLVALILGWPVSSSLAAQAKSLSLPELALYKGKDRGNHPARRRQERGTSHFLYLKHLAGRPRHAGIRQEISIHQGERWRSDSKELLKRLTDEAAAGRYIADVVETSPDYMALLIAAKMFQEVYSPELDPYENSAKIKGKNGVFNWTSRELYISLGFNTNLIPPAEAPKTMKDLLDPK